MPTGRLHATDARCRTVLGAKTPKSRCWQSRFFLQAQREREGEPVPCLSPSTGGSQRPCASRGLATQRPILCFWCHAAFLTSVSASSRGLPKSHWI